MTMTDLRRRQYTILVACIVIVFVVVLTTMLVYETTPSQAGGPETWDERTRQKVEQAYEEARQYLASDQPAKARLILEDCVRKHPGDPMTHQLLSQAVAAEGDPRGSYEQALKALALNRRLVGVQIWAGTLAFQLRDYDQAEQHYAEACKLAPTEARYPLYLASVQLKRKKPDLDKAEFQILKAIQLDANLSKSYAMLADVDSRRGMLSDAIRHINKALEHTDDVKEDAAYTIQKAQFLRRDNDPHAALEAVAALPDSMRHQMVAVRDLATSYLMLSQPNDAAELWADYYAKNPSDVQGAAEAGLCYHRADKPSTAAVYLRQAQKIDPDHPTVKALAKALSDQE